MNAIAQITTTAVSNPLMPTDMGAAFRLAEMMATGKLVPSHLQRQPGDCLMVIEQAVRWGMSPFAVAQCTSVIQGKLMFEGKLVGAALQASGLLSERMNYEFSGDGENRSVRAFATIRGEGKPREVVVCFKDVKTTNGLWTKQPDQQLIYSANRIWARRHAPEVMLGTYSPEEFDQPQQRDTFAGTTIDAKAEAAYPTQPESVQAGPQNDPREQAQGIANIYVAKIRAAQSAQALTNLISKPNVSETRGRLAAEFPDIADQVTQALDEKAAEFASASPNDAPSTADWDMPPAN